MPQILECRIGQEKYQKKGNLAPERGKKFVFLCLPPSSYDLSQSCRVVAHGTRDSYKEPPLPIWCSVRLPLNHLVFNGLWAQYVSAESRERETRLRNLKVRENYTFILLAARPATQHL